MISYAPLRLPADRSLTPMKAREFKPLFKALLPSMPGFVAHKRMLLKAPMNGMLRAIHLDASDDKYVFYPATVVVPLCVPTDFLSLLFGHRMRTRTRGWSWTMKMPNLESELRYAILDQGLPYLAKADTLEGFVELASEFSGNPHTPKKVAFTVARAGQIDRAIAMIDDYVPKIVPHVAWAQKIIDDSKALRAMLVEDPDAAVRQLMAWEDHTIAKLGLQAFR